MSSDKAALITPRTLKGFRDFLPGDMLAREQLIDTARRVYRSYGFAPIDTPALEYIEILLGKSGEETEKQMYRFTDSASEFATDLPMGEDKIVYELRVMHIALGGGQLADTRQRSVVKIEPIVTVLFQVADHAFQPAGAQKVGALQQEDRPILGHDAAATPQDFQLVTFDVALNQVYATRGVMAEVEVE